MISQKNLIICQIEHDKCRQTKRYLWPGQNLAMFCRMPIRTVDEAIQLSNDAWWDEYKNITYIDRENNYKSIKANDQYGHFTQMARDKAYAMGCAAISNKNGYCFFIACNYAITNWGYDPVYAFGPVRSKCKTKSRKYPGLCGDKEDYTNYTKLGVKFFTKDNSVVPPLRQWYANGRILDIPFTPSNSAIHRYNKPTTAASSTPKGQRKTPIHRKPTTVPSKTSATFKPHGKMKPKIKFVLPINGDMNDINGIMADIKKQFGQTMGTMKSNSINYNDIQKQMLIMKSKFNTSAKNVKTSIRNGNKFTTIKTFSGSPDKLPDWAKKKLGLF